MKTIMPTLTVDDLQASIRFFEGLGFAIGDRWEHEGKLLGVSVKAGDIEIGLSQDDWKKGKREKGLGVRFYIGTTQNIDEIGARAKKNGVALDKDAHDTEWGARAIDLTEPSGFKFTIASDLTPA
jgi:catechol 2,3-dioxygenase-like lactoylglutathione lyase family enzyme